MTKKQYVIEVRDQAGRIDLDKRRVVEKDYPYLFSKPSFSIDELCHYASYGQGRDTPTGPMGLGSFMGSIGASYREKYW